MTAIILTPAALRAALATARQMGADYDDDSRAASFFIDTLNVLEALLDPAHQPAPAARDGLHAFPLTAMSIDAMRGSAGPAPTLAQEEAQPAHADSIAAAEPPIVIPPLPAGPGCAAPADRGAPEAEAAALEPTPQPAPLPVLAAEGATIPEAKHAPPGDHRPTRTQRITLTDAQEAKLRALWADRTVRGAAIREAVNALDGPRVTNDGTLYSIAHRLGLRTRSEVWAEQDNATHADAREPAATAGVATPLPAEPPSAEPPPAPAPPAPDAVEPAGRPRIGPGPIPAALTSAGDLKAEVFDAFDRGLSVRDIAADFGEPIAMLSAWQAEWRLRQKQGAST